ncbi:hypothetical protein F441_09962 [Phytophthora nicotianae CJ01A1]|uniref:Uncharacterized protein n=6 Tax=Phytophthora nicotianae TaxID=4792 RepID=W2R7A8_PHYN3|nr:hypothetical protein PPTG_01509 [Phytophthora nicotianae INRA-310]XP_008917172.1 hypothetical protein PPTG_24922 [Phytophthora nicotianae INRA-310]ETI45395.1 hypothetical protein F443_10018 [Phytophthora nicotianae P1569]ETL91896.1 hypothetical protein L917_09642 [Phytophthora nicotianae]ETO74039.1 hypothetical protein F444_10109 [Phytophthora nicotianae P1976]ETP15205.1 hypothetical protein F441_09962 [Phytophthora nicotianae CJ01A1]ETP43283.1 hypothetical protein F442_09920 [Phytophthora
MASLGLRSANSYNDLVDVYSGSFCRMCYTYACHEHGGDHPLPVRRVDPVYPRVRLSSDDNVVCVGNEVTSGRDDLNRKVAVSNVSKKHQIGVASDADMSVGDTKPY